MRNLLSAGFARLWRSKVFWLSCAFLAAATVSSVWTRYSDGFYYLDTAFMYYVLFIAILIPLVCALFIGTDYADGTIRNKLICGHSRGSLYLSNLIVCSAASLIMCTFAVVPGLCVGLPLLGGFTMDPVKTFLFFICVYTLSLVWTALFTLLAMLVSNRTVAVVAALLLSLTLLAAGANLNDPADVPEGRVRDTIQFLSDSTPGGQTLQLVNQRAERPEVLMAYDAVLFALSTGAGLLLFRRKDLK